MSDHRDVLKRGENGSNLRVKTLNSGRASKGDQRLFEWNPVGEVAQYPKQTAIL